MQPFRSSFINLNKGVWNWSFLLLRGNRLESLSELCLAQFSINQLINHSINVNSVFFWLLGYFCCTCDKRAWTQTKLTRPMIGFEQAAQTPFGCTITPCSARFWSSASIRTDRSPAFCFDAGNDVSGDDTLPLSSLTSVTGRLVVLTGKRFNSSDTGNVTLTKKMTK